MKVETMTIWIDGMKEKIMRVNAEEKHREIKEVKTKDDRPREKWLSTLGDTIELVSENSSATLRE